MSAANVLVIGGTGGVGEGVVRALLGEGRFERVVVASRDAAKLETLAARATPERLATVLGSVDARPDAEALLAAARSHGPLHAVVASLGGWWEGPALTALDEPTWATGLDTLLTPHFVAARTFVPALETNDCRYLLVGGGAALTPVPGSTLVSIAGAAQLMFARALVAERLDRPWPIVEELVIDGAVKTRARHHGPETPGEITARDVGDVVAAMLRDGSTGAWPNATRDGAIVTMRPLTRPSRVG